jgi:hypothetical protein
VGDDRAYATTGAADAAVRVWGGERRGVDVRAAYGSAVARSLAGYPLYLAVAARTQPVGGLGLGGGYDVQPLPRFERTRELEAGVDLRVGPAFTAALTAYDQHTRDVLTPGPADPYQPYGGVAQMGLANRGVEASVRARLVERPGLGAELGLRAWGARNRVRNLDSPAWLTQTRTGISQVVRDGAALGAYTGAPGAPRARDYNGDGLVTSAEAARALAEARQAAGNAPAPTIGSPVATRTAAADLRARVGARLTLSALAEYQGGARGVGDGAALFDAARGAVDPGAPVAEQARAAAAYVIPEVGLERADFVRLREVSAGWRLRGGRAGGAGTTVTLAARNLLTGTAYSGRDPEAGGSAAMSGLYAVPVARTVALRVAAAW